LKNTRERLASLEATINSEKAGLANLEKEKKALEDEIAEAEKEIENLRTELQTVTDRYREAAKETDEAKAVAASAQKSLDNVLRQIASWVRSSRP
jgi:structural maintenance of chromosome 1